MRRGIGGAALRRRQPIADEKKEPGFRYGLAVERQRCQIAGFARPSGIAKAAGREMGSRLLAGRLSAEGDAQPAPVRVRRLRKNGDPCVLRHERRERHPAEPRLVRLQDRRTAGEHCGGHKERSGERPGDDSSPAPPRREAPLLGAIAADFHFAPPPTVVLAAIIEQPAAGVAAAFSDAVKIAFSEEPDRGKRDWTQRGLDRGGAHAPRPAARHNPGASSALATNRA